MTAIILDANALTQRRRAERKARAEALVSRGSRPGLGLIPVGEREAR
jgi:regulator of protease activity HflC (stomatin/prohibitin superfamily)